MVSLPTMPAVETCPVPGYVPAVVRPLLPWSRRLRTRVAARYGLGVADLWDEGLTALLRAACHWQPALGAFGPYARTTVHRGLYRYVVRAHVWRRRHGTVMPLENAVESLELTA